MSILFFPMLCSTVTTAAKAEPNRKGNSGILSGHLRRWKEDFLVTIISLVLPSPSTLPLAQYWFIRCERRASKDMFFGGFFTWPVHYSPPSPAPHIPKQKSPDGSRPLRVPIEALGTSMHLVGEVVLLLAPIPSLWQLTQRSLQSRPVWTQTRPGLERTSGLRGENWCSPVGFWTHRTRP